MAGLSRQLCALSHPKKAAETQTAEAGGAHAVCSRHPVRVKGLEGSEMESAREIIDLQPGSSDPRRSQPINLNHYATKKSVAESMLDVALFMSNAMRLKAVLEQGPSSHYYTTLVTLISLSLLLQVVIGVLLVVIGEEPSLQSGLLPRHLRPAERPHVFPGPPCIGACSFATTR
nr:ninjurin-2 isoform X1 [Symphalangus syndactylus]